jgi:phosphoesterase RecJ-like protein
MFEKIYERIKLYDSIVIARHIGVDPDALGSQLALKLSILGTFPDKKVYAVGTRSSRYNYFPKLDKFDGDPATTLLIVTDTPDIKRIDLPNFSDFKDVCKIDHHPFIDKFGDNEFIDTDASSASEIVLKFIKENNMYFDTEVAKCLFYGIVSDTNRFLFNTNENTLRIVANLIEEYKLDTEELYSDLLLRPISEIRFQGYISSNMKLTDNGLAYVIITDDIIKEYGVDVSSAGNMVNNFNNIEEVLVWTMVTEDVKNNLIKFNIRSRGPVINTIAENYNGGGHKFASGARVPTMNEAKMLLDDLNKACEEYIEKEGMKNES